MVSIRALLALLPGLITRRPRARYEVLGAIAKRWGFRLEHPHLTWRNDSDVLAELRRFGNVAGLTPKRHNLYYLARSVTQLEGATAECGVATGVTSHLIARATRGRARLHHGFDSFEGLSSPEEADRPPAGVDALKAGDYAEPLDRVQSRFLDNDCVVLHQGWIPEVFSALEKDERFIFVHVDVDFHRPTLDSLDFFYRRVVQGGLIVCDDYGFLGTPGARSAVDEFFADKPETVVNLSSGQALIAKH